MEKSPEHKTIKAPDHKSTRIQEQEIAKTKEEAKTEDLKTKKLRLPKVLLPIVGIVITLVLLWLGMQMYERSKVPSGEGIKFPPKKVIAQIGQEALYGQDLNYELKIYFPETSKSPEPVPEEIKTKVLNQIIEKSLLLQAAADEDLITLNEKVFNKLDKAYRERNILLNSIESKANQKFVNWVKGEMISIWFHNIYEPKMGLETARQVTQVKMENVYNRLKSGGFSSLEEAAEVIKNDPSLALIDPSYKGNAYITFEAKQGEEFFIDSKVQEMAFKLSPGQLSEIIVGRDKRPVNEFYDCCFIVLKVIDQKLEGFRSFEDWFNQKRKNYAVEIKI